MRLLVTRPAEDAARTAAAAAARGHDPIIAPVIEIRPLKADLPERPFQAVIVTSANALRAIAARPQVARLKDLPLVAVGGSTAETARLQAFSQIITAEGTADSVLARISSNLAPEKGPLLHLSGDHLARDLAEALSPHGYEVVRAIVYEAVPAQALSAEAVTALKHGKVDAVALFSPRSAHLFGALVRHEDLSTQAGDILWACLSQNVADAAAEAGARHIVTAARPDETALLEALDH